MRNTSYKALVILLTASMLMGTGAVAAYAADTTSSAVEAVETLADGQYVATFDTDSGMFHANEANEDKGLLTVKDGQMTFHVSLTSTNIVNLFPGTAADAQAEGAEILQPTLDTVTYSDGTSEEVNGFDIPVPALDTEFDLALIGTKGKWYDHKVVISDATPATEEEVEKLQGAEPYTQSDVESVECVSETESAETLA